MARTYVYIDALNFYYGAVKNTANKWVDFEALARLLVPRDTIGCIRYFTAPITPRYATDKGHERQNALLRAMGGNPLIKIHKGHFRSDVKWRALADQQFAVRDLFRPQLYPDVVARWLIASSRRRSTKPFSAVRVLIDEEKGSDVNLGSYLVYDASTKACSKAIVITNDSDLAEPIRLATTFGIQVGLVNPHPGTTSRHLRQVASFQIPFRRGVVAKCQLPATVLDHRGRQIHRPKEWR